MIIGISGKIGSGKDTIGKIIQYLTWIKEDTHIPYQNFINNIELINNDFKIKKFADKLKDIVCLLIGCTREQLEDQEFKNTVLGEEWIRYGYADGFMQQGGQTTMLNKACDKERYELELRTNWQTAYKSELTPRLLLQLLGTDCGRNIIHPNIWVNSLFSEYKENSISKDKHIIRKKGKAKKGFGGKWQIPNTPPFPASIQGKFIDSEDFEYETLDYIEKSNNWIITDTRFTNELKAIKDRQGISIRVNRSLYSYGDGIYTLSELFSEVWKDTGEYPNKDYIDKHWLVKNDHESETALDNAEFDYTIDNNGTIEELIEKVKEILIKENIINN